MKKFILFYRESTRWLNCSIQYLTRVFKGLCFNSSFQGIKFNKNAAYSLTFLLLVFSQVSSYGQNPSANLDQIRNGSAASPISPANWVNGNAGAQQAHYLEGWSIPYRMLLENLTNGSSNVLVIEWDTRDNSKHAIDFITSYNNMDNPGGSHTGLGHSSEIIDPTIGITGLGAPSTFPIPAPNANVPSAYYLSLSRQFTIYNGTITNVAYVNQDALNTASAKTRIAITFTANSAKVLIAWGGHIAAEYDWGTGQGATAINGSPYHTRLISLNGSGGNQDRSLAAAAVIIPPRCSVSGPATACADANSLIFTSTILNPNNDVVTYAWTLVNNSAGAQISGSSTGSSITVVPSGADFTAGSFVAEVVVTRKFASNTCSQNCVINALPSVTANDASVCTGFTVQLTLHHLEDLGVELM